MFKVVEPHSISYDNRSTRKYFLIQQKSTLFIQIAAFNHDFQRLLIAPEWN